MDHWISEVWIYEDLRVSEGHLGTGPEGRFWVNSEVILGPFLDPILETS